MRGTTGCARRAIPVATVVALLLAASPVHAAPSPRDTPTEMAELTAAQQAMARADEALDAAEGRAAAAEGAVKEVEAELVTVLVSRLDARAEAARTAAAARGAVLARQRFERDLADERAALTEQAVAAYKLGPARNVVLALRLMQAAEDPNEFARNSHDLAVILDGQQQLVAAVGDLLAATRAHEAEAITAAAAAADRLSALDDEVEALEVEAARLRDLADEAEGVVVDRLGAALAAERRLSAAGAAAEEAAQRAAAVARDATPEPVSSPAPTTDPSVAPSPTPAPAPEPEPAPIDPRADPTAAAHFHDHDAEAAAASVDQRSAWLEGRQRALAAARSLVPDQRRARDDLVCPVDGEVVFVNDWHYPRSHGRRHEGTDLFAARGTRVVATVSGTILAVDPVDTFDGDSDLGGITVTYGTPDDRWYAAHLTGVVDGLETGDPIEAGELIGWVGDTGNAAGTPYHLHLGWYRDDVAVNAWSSLTVACSRDAPRIADRQLPLA